MKKSKIKKSKPKKVASFGELNKRFENAKPPKILWGGITPNSIGFVFGLPKSGKTIICENLAFSIASGRSNFLGIPIELQSSKVLFISMEEYVGTRIIQRGKNQYEDFSSEEKKILNENLYYSDEDFLRSLKNDEKDWIVLEEEIQKIRPKLVFIDSVNRFEMKIEDRDETNKLMRKIRELSQNYKCAIILIHHTTKAQKDKPITLEHMSGSSALGRDADLFIGINSLSNDTRYIKFLDNRYCETPDKSILFSIQNDYIIDFEGMEYESELMKSIDSRFNSSNTQLVADFIRDNVDVDGCIKLKIMYSYFVTDNKMFRKKTLHNQLKKLIESETIVKSGHGKYKLVSKTNEENEKSNEEE
jgi:archaellum biogenesis ATPase FlaH